MTERYYTLGVPLNNQRVYSIRTDRDNREHAYFLSEKQTERILRRAAVMPHRLIGMSLVFCYVRVYWRPYITLQIETTQRHYRMHNQVWQKTNRRVTELRGLFRELQTAYGRCTSRLYVELGDKTHAVGWLFLCGGLETCVTLYAGPPECGAYLTVDGKIVHTERA